jgi:hypothetical protein
MLWNIFYWVFGVATCAYFAAETVGATYTNPILCWLFMPLLIIPVSNCLMLATDSAKRSPERDVVWMASLQAVALAVSTLLLLILTPLILIGVIGALMFLFLPQMCLIALFFVCVATGPFVTSFALYERFWKRLPKDAKMPGLSRASALSLVMCCVLFAILPVTLTHYCQVAVENPTQRKQALLLLRALGDENTLLKSCYDQYLNLPWYFSFLHGAVNDDYNGGKYLPARELFYRVKGVAFNSVARPNDPTARDLYFDDDADWFWYRYWRNDRDFASDTVGGIVKGLSLDKSKITGWVDANEAVSHLNWKMHFANSDARDSELRGQLLLPPHAVITGCSLWIKGVKHEAVFAERNSAKQAYTRSAEKGETPLLVSTAGAGRVLLQSSMGTWGKEAELEVELTAPLTIVEKGQANLPLPVFSERNFAVPGKHTVDILSATPVAAKSVPLSSAGSAVGSNQIHLVGSLTNSDICSNLGTLSFNRNPDVTVVQAVSPLTSGAIQEAFSVERKSASTPLMVVVDGSAGMSNSIQTICQALTQQHFSDATLVWASDLPQTLASHVDTSSAVWHDAVKRLADSSCLGGQDNGAALAQAVQDAGMEGRAVNVVWLHGTQPVAFKGPDLLELISSSKSKVRLVEYQIEPGPNVVIKSLDQLSDFEQVPRIKGVTGDLQLLFARLAGASETFKILRTDGVAAAGARPSAHPLELAQLSVSDSILTQLSDDKMCETNGKMAESLHLVTPLTSALVLETAEMYRDYNVKKFGGESVKALQDKAKQAPLGVPGITLPDTISTKPEPPMSLLMAIALLIMMPVLWLTRKRKQHA